MSFDQFFESRTGSCVDLMSEDLCRYARMRQLTDEDDVFRHRLDQLQRWQINRLQLTHKDMLSHDRYKLAAEFMLTQVYGGIDLSALVRDITRAIPVAVRIFPERVMRTAALALELNALTGELDEWMVRHLFETMGLKEITPEGYAQAYRNHESYPLRVRQIELAQQLGRGIDRYIASRMIYAAFKVARGPANAAGLGALYQFMEKGYAVLRPLRSAEEFLSLITERERELIDRIYANHDDPFFLDGEHALLTGSIA